MKRPRIHLSVPHMCGLEEGYVREAFSSNWLSTVGPNIDAFESEFSAHLGLASVALGSGTAALHLALRLVGVQAGDEVVCSSLTFVATANPIVYLGAKPVFIDSDHGSWNMDPELLATFLEERAAKGRLPRAVVLVHLYGQSADLDPIVVACKKHGVALVEDAAEAVGTLYKGRPVGTFGDVSIFSFNGNKMITTTGGGMLCSPRKDWVDKARFWSTQAREPGIAYVHTEMGYNYRLSNVLAGIGRGQLTVIEERVRQRRAVAFRYRDAFADLPGITLMPQAAFGRHTNWLSCFLVQDTEGGAHGGGEGGSQPTRDDLIAALAADDIEARPVWKPMHMQPLFAHAERVGGGVSERLFAHGLCLPSSSSLTEGEQDRVVDVIRGVWSSKSQGSGVAVSRSKPAGPERSERAGHEPQAG
jgi:pyridoxal phosphate-dependent aminotransferase EpsN